MTEEKIENGADGAAPPDSEDAAARAADGAKVFLSYSRRDREQAQRISEVLRGRDYGVFRDTDDILPTEAWRERLQQLIEEADTIVFLMSRASLSSEVCAWEVELADSLGKRIAPLVIEDVDGAEIPPVLARLNYIFATDRDPFENAVASLVSALETDVDWVREHTRLGGLARRWERANKAARLLLRGADIADAEAWRDARPREAPELTPVQTAFIAASRAAAGARQRNWIMGALGIAAATAALAVFAYFQSVEADRQRVAAIAASEEADRQRGAAEENAAEAERQRGVAEDNAAEAERQRAAAEDNAAEAEARRVEALTTLAAARLNAGDRAGGLSALLDADPDLDVAPRRMLLAGLAAPEEALGALPPGAPFVFNGALHLNHADGPRALEPFPARYWAMAGDDPLLIGGAGALRRLTTAGETKDTAAYETAFTPCFTEPDPANAGALLFGYRSTGYSACSFHAIVSYTDRDAIYGQHETYACSDDKVRFLDGRVEPVAPNAVLDICWQGAPTQEALGEAFPDARLDALRPVEDVTFPLSVGETALWAPLNETTGDAPARRALAAVDALPLHEDWKSLLPVTYIEPDQISGYLLPEIAKAENLTVMRSVINWGGTGGEIDMVCDAVPAEPMYCASFHHFSGIHGVRLAEGGRGYIIFGEQIAHDNGGDDTGRHSAFWVEPGYSPYPLWFLGSYGAIRDFAISLDGLSAAILTDTALATFRLPNGDDVYEDVAARTAPRGAATLVWGDDGRLIVGADDGALWFETAAGGWERRAADPALAASSDPDVPTQHWLTRAGEGGLIAFGYGDAAQVFDLALRAPLTGAVKLGDTRLGFRAKIPPALEASAEGGITLRFAETGFTRAAPPADADPAHRLSPDAPLQ